MNSEVVQNRTQRSNFTQVPNEILNSTELSWGAKGLWAYMAGKPEGWKFTVRLMARQCRDSITSTTSKLKELLDAGYVTREIVMTKNGKKCLYGIYDCPSLENTSWEKPSLENQILEYSNKDISNKESSKKENKFVTKVTSGKPQGTSFDTEQKELENQLKDNDLPSNLEILVSKTSLKGEEPKNVVNGELTPQVSPPPLPMGKVRVVDESGKVVGGNPLTERAYELWQEIMGQPCKRDKWNGQAGYNMMRAKNKGEGWLKGMLMIARECKKDLKADYRASHVANLADVQKNQDALMDWYRQRTLKHGTVADRNLEFLRNS